MKVDYRSQSQSPRKTLVFAKLDMRHRWKSMDLYLWKNWVMLALLKFMTSQSGPPGSRSTPERLLSDEQMSNKVGVVHTNQLIKGL